MRILHVNDLPVDEARQGVEIYISRLARAQRQGNHEVFIHTAERKHRGIGRLLDLWDPIAARHLREHVKATAPDVIHFHNVVRELSPSVLSATAGTPAVATIHDLRIFGGLEHHLPDPRAAVDRAFLGPLMRRQLRRHVALLVAVSEVVKRHIAHYGFTAIVVRIPVPPPFVPPLSVEECCDVVFVGRLSPDKGVEILISAFESIAHQHPKARLVIVGGGPDRARLEKRARRNERVVFTGALDETEVSAVIGKARLVVTPSISAMRREGSSITTAEAARHGRPVVTSDDPAVAEVASAVGGQIVPAKDTDALSRAIDRWLSDAAAAARAGKRARLGAINTYGVDRIRDQMDEVYETVIR